MLLQINDWWVYNLFHQYCISLTSTNYSCWMTVTLICLLLTFCRKWNVFRVIWYIKTQCSKTYYRFVFFSRKSDVKVNRRWDQECEFLPWKAYISNYKLECTQILNKKKTKSTKIATGKHVLFSAHMEQYSVSWTYSIHFYILKRNSKFASVNNIPLFNWVH